MSGLFDWLGSWSTALLLLFKGDTVLTLVAGIAWAAVCLTVLRIKAPPVLKLIVVLIATGFCGLILAFAFDWIG